MDLWAVSVEVNLDAEALVFLICDCTLLAAV